MDTPITVQVHVNASLSTVWQCWSEPEHIPGWAFASDDWHAPEAENDLRVGGQFRTTMAAKDGSARFDFAGTYTEVKEHELIAYEMDDGRNVRVTFEDTPEGVTITETFDPEHENPAETQRAGWQAILDNFKKYVESRATHNP